MDLSVSGRCVDCARRQPVERDCSIAAAIKYTSCSKSAAAITLGPWWRDPALCHCIAGSLDVGVRPSSSCTAQVHEPQGKMRCDGELQERHCPCENMALQAGILARTAPFDGLHAAASHKARLPSFSKVRPFLGGAASSRRTIWQSSATLWRRSNDAASLVAFWCLSILLCLSGLCMALEHALSRWWIRQN